MSCTHILLAFFFSGSLVFASPRCIAPGAKSLKGLHARWTNEQDCGKREEVWMTVHDCFKDVPNWFPAVSEVGDCWMRTGNESRAKRFYQAIAVSQQMCGVGGCDYYAREELGALDCGFRWLASSPEEVWNDILLSVRTSPLKGNFHIAPWVGYPLDNTKGCPEKAFAILPSLVDAAKSIAKAIGGDRKNALERVIVIPINPKDGELHNSAIKKPGDRPYAGYSYYELRACPYPRPVPNQNGKYFLQISPLMEENLGRRPNLPCRR